jgi:hypothetical protein
MMVGSEELMEDEEDRDLEKLYPKVYFRVMPLIRHHCDEMEWKHGIMYCPHKDELKKIAEEICERLEDECDDDDDDDHHHHDDEHCDHREYNSEDEEDTRQIPRRRRRPYRDLASVLFLRELYRRRRRRRFPYGGYGYWR